MIKHWIKFFFIVKIKNDGHHLYGLTVNNIVSFINNFESNHKLYKNKIITTEDYNNIKKLDKCFGAI